MTWAEADRSWIKAKGRSVRTVLDSVDLMKTREKSRRRRKAAAAAFFGAAGLGLAALVVLAFSGGGPGDREALANITESVQDAGNSGEQKDVSFASAAGATTGGTVSAGIKASAGGSGGPASGNVNGGGGVDAVIPPGLISGPKPPVDTVSGGDDGNGGGGGTDRGGGGGNDGGTEGGGSPIDASATLSDPLGGGSLLSGDGAVEGLLSLSGEVGSEAVGGLIPQGTLPDTDLLPDSHGDNLLDVDVSGDPENRDDPVDTSAEVNAGDTDASVDDDLWWDLLGGLLD
jgi:hypothetical protein